MAAKNKIPVELLSKLESFSKSMEGREKSWIKNLIQKSIALLYSDSIDSNLGTENCQLSNVLICILIEAAKYDFDVTELSAEILKSKLQPIFEESICEVYDLNKQKIRTNMSKIGYRYPTIIDCDWKLDYQIKSDAQEELDRPNFIINLKIAQCDQPEELTNFKFQCSSEQIQDMLWKLKEASKFVEKIAYQ